eukprot:13328816-Ditylum_brightwellii.AAC.1
MKGQLDKGMINTMKEIKAIKKIYQSELYNQQIKPQKKLDIALKEHKLEVQNVASKHYKEIRNATKMVVK